LIAVLGIVGLVLGGAVAVARRATFTSSAVVSAGPVSALSSSDSATTDALASSYAAVVPTTTFERRVAAALHTDVGYVAARLSATAAASSALVTITGKGSSAALAERLATTAATALRRDFPSAPTSSGSGQSLLQRYSAASATQAQLQSRVTRLTAALATPAKVLQSAKVALAVAQLRTQALAAAYTASTQASGLGTDARPTLVSAASAASSDRSKKAAEFAIVGLIVGLCLGASVLTLVAAGSPAAKLDRGADDARLEKA
jgi:hypothetical protein